ncbi:MAG: methionine adenosyltransferase [Patescibacteria group bacterium]
MFVPLTYSVESVTSGHPDKMCDQISDAILDAILVEDPTARVAIETFGAHGQLVIAGEVTTTATPDYAATARRVYRDIGYDDNLNITVHVVQQSPDIARGVDIGGAGDQGIMYGFATDETLERLPLGVVLSHRLAQGLEKLRRNDSRFSWLRPDGKTQVTINNGRVVAVVVSAQHDESVALEILRQQLTDQLIMPTVSQYGIPEMFINPAGEWHRGGFAADTGLTGRKIMVDAYGGLIPHGGGCFSGKDATKVDRSGAYMARYAAVEAINQGLAKQCLVSVAYAIGRAEPVMLEASDANGRRLTPWLRKNFDFRPRAIIERLNLRRPQFKRLAAYGHFGRSERW